MTLHWYHCPEDITDQTYQKVSHCQEGSHCSLKILSTIVNAAVQPMQTMTFGVN